jgi:alpha-galactosidase
MKAAPWNVNDGHRTHEHGSYIIESLETRRPYRGHFNVVNSGCISNLPDDCVVEAPGYVDGNGIGIPRVGPLPLACAATLSATVNVQRMSVHAAVAGDVTLLKQAVLHDPLTGAVCDPEAVWQMVDEMLVAQARWLPQYRDAIPAARRRLAAARRAGAVRGAGRSRGAFRVNPRKASRRPE